MKMFGKKITDKKFKARIDAAIERDDKMNIRVDLAHENSEILCVNFVYHGAVIGKPRMTRRDKWAKRPCVMRYWAFKDEIKRQFAVRCGNIDKKPISLSWRAYIAMPKSWSKKKKEKHCGQLHMQKPDRDNIDKAIMDAIFKEDKCIATGKLQKYWDDGQGQRIVITILYGKVVNG